MRRWTAAYRFRYLPVISFERRRSALLDWVEEHLEPVSFRDERNEVGIALRPGVRIRISRSLTTLEDSVAAKDGVASLWPMLDGLFEAMEPRGLSLHSASSAWSADLPDWEYADATRSLAERVSGVTAALPSGVRPVDVAPLVDFNGERFSIQAEYGVVSPPELMERLNDDELGKVEGRPGGDIRPAAIVDVAPASLFVATGVHLNKLEWLTDQAGMQHAVEEFETAAREVAEAIAASAMSEREIAK